MTPYAHAFPLQLAREAILLGKYTDAINLVAPLSKSADDHTLSDEKLLDAHFFHALLHVWDDDFSRDAALEQMTRVAAQNHPEANYILAVCPDLILGDGFRLPQTDGQLAYLWQAYLLGSVAAGADLADCYLQGVGVPQSRSVARLILHSVVRWRTYANDPKACYHLGTMLLEDNMPNMDYFALGMNDELLGNKHTLACRQKHHDWLIEIDVDSSSLALSRMKIDKHRANLRPEWESYLYHFCRQTLRYDLCGADFDAFCDFVFDHYPQSWRDRDRFQWDRTAKVTFHSGELTRFYTALFNDSAFLVERYAEMQIKQGLGMHGIRGKQDWSIGCAMTSPQTTVDEAEALIHSQYNLFMDLFGKGGFLGSDLMFMWWDIGYGGCTYSRQRYPERRRKDSKADKQRLRQATFDVQVRVLTESKYHAYEFQDAALHGLNHWTHPNRREVIQKYLDDNPNISLWVRERAEAAMDGKLM